MALNKGYVGAGACTKGPQTGARGFMSWYLAKYSKIGGQNSGIYNCRPVRGSSYVPSIHGEGRAVDLGIKFARKEFSQLAEQLRLHSKELGIQCIIYNRKIWSAGYKVTTFQKYTGVNPHTDHLHVEMDWWSAKLSAAKYIELLEKTLGGKVGNVKPSGSKPKPKPSTPAKTVKENSGNTKEDNIAIAKTLNALGFKAGEPDGVPGTYLRAGVKAYQNAQVYFPKMKVDGDWSKMTQAHFDWVRHKLQATLNQWTASQKLGKLAEDGNYMSVTGAHVRAVEKGNAKLYAKAGGKRYDHTAGPIFCKMIDIPKHPSA